MLKIYLKIKITETGKERQRDRERRDHLLILIWARAEPGVRSFIWVFHVDGRDTSA